jgi:SAM-dependent methyltransferase
MEWKMIRARDGLLSLLAMIRFWLIDDMYQADEYGSYTLIELERTRRFNLWTAETLRPFIGNRVLELGARTGTMTSQVIPRELYVAADTNPHYLHYLRSYSSGKPYLRVLNIDASNGEDFRGLGEQFDTVLALNTLEHVADEEPALRNIWSALEPGGRVIVLAPQHPALYGTLDEALQRRRRYTAADLQSSLARAGFGVEKMFDMNRVSVPGWWLKSKLLRRKKFSRLQLKALDTMIPLLKRLDRGWPWSGLSLIAIGVKQ